MNNNCKFYAQRAFGWIISWTYQGNNAPLVDSCVVIDKDGNRYQGWAILLTPWRRDRHGQSLIQPALVVARKRK